MKDENAKDQPPELKKEGNGFLSGFLLPVLTFLAIAAAFSFPSARADTGIIAILIIELKIATGIILWLLLVLTALRHRLTLGGFSGFLLAEVALCTFWELFLT